MSRGALRLQAQNKIKASLVPMTDEERIDPEKKRLEEQRVVKEIRLRKQKAKAENVKAKSERKSKTTAGQKTANTHRRKEKKKQDNGHASSILYADFELATRNHLKDL